MYLPDMSCHQQQSGFQQWKYWRHRFLSSFLKFLYVPMKHLVDVEMDELMNPVEENQAENLDDN